MERVGLFEIARTINARMVRRESSSSSEESPSSTAELSMYGNQAGMDYHIKMLFGVKRIMGSRHTFFTIPPFQNLLFVEGQGIAVAIQHSLGTLFGSLSH